MKTSIAGTLWNQYILLFMKNRLLQLASMSLLASFTVVSLYAQDMKKVNVKREWAENGQILREYAQIGFQESESNFRLRASTSEAWPDSTLRFSADGKKERKVIYTYDASGNAYQREAFNWQNNSWASSLKVRNEYDSSGNLILSENFACENNTWIGSNKYEYFYNESGNQTKYIWYTWENNDWSILSIRTYNKGEYKSESQVYILYLDDNGSTGYQFIFPTGLVGTTSPCSA